MAKLRPELSLSLKNLNRLNLLLIDFITKYKLIKIYLRSVFELKKQEKDSLRLRSAYKGIDMSINNDRVWIYGYK